MATPRDQLQKMMEKKRIEADTLKGQLIAAEAYIAAMQDAIRVMPKEPNGDGAVVLLREGSKLAKARDFLAQNGKAMHINQILIGIGDPPDTKSRVALTGSLGQYARDNKIFTKEGPNEFGLIEYPETLDKRGEIGEVSAAPEDYAHNAEITDDDIPF